MFGERRRSHASATCIGVAWSAAAAASMKPSSARFAKL